MEKNGWMNEVVPIMGDERTLKSRKVSNEVRSTKVSSLKPKTSYQSRIKRPPTCMNYFNTIPNLMG